MASQDDFKPTFRVVHIVLSCFISWIGCITTLELLHRRTSTKGAYNWYLLESATVTMGGVGIWSMHFVGNNAIDIAGARLAYDTRWTTLSFFLPILVLNAAFYFLATSDSNASALFIAIAGTLTGVAVCAMHYVGQLGVLYYTCSYDKPNIAGATIISIAASLLALSVFFRSREGWTNSWWKRSMCGAVLAAAVAGMHWTAAVGTTYHRRANTTLPSITSKVPATSIVTSVLSISACFALLGIAIVTGHRIRTIKRRAQELVLACAYFDDQGRIMVTGQGSLPNEKITSHFIERTFGEDEISKNHPTFTWIYKASRNWRVIHELIPIMQTHTDSDPDAQIYLPGRQTNSDPSIENAANFGDTFKRLFCLAAYRLANNMNVSFEKLGDLFEQPLETATVRESRRGAPNSVDDDPEKSPGPSFGKGKYLFVTRKLTKIESKHFSAHGYRFKSPEMVIESLGRDMQVSYDEIQLSIQRMSIASSKDGLLPPGIHLAGFILRPSLSKGFDVLVPTTKQNQMPHVQLATTFTKWHHKFLARFDEMTVQDMLEILINELTGPDLERRFKWSLHESLATLANQIGDFQSFMQARFSVKYVHAPCRGSTPDSPLTCVLYTVRALGTLHTCANNKQMTYVPLNFFNTQQLVVSSPVANEAFQRHLRVEYGLSIKVTRDFTVVTTECNSPKRQVEPTRRPKSRHSLSFPLSIWRPRKSHSPVEQIDALPQLPASIHGRTMEGGGDDTRNLMDRRRSEGTSFNSRNEEIYACKELRSDDSVDSASVAMMSGNKSFVPDLLALFRF